MSRIPFGPNGCQAVVGGQHCRETETLQIIQQFKSLYECKLQQIEDEAGGGDCLPGLQAKVSLQQEWIRDLTQQNEMLVRAVEELEQEASDRVAMLEEKLQASVRRGTEVMQKYKDLNFSINLDETPLGYPCVCTPPPVDCHCEKTAVALQKKTEMLSTMEDQIKILPNPVEVDKMASKLQDTEKELTTVKRSMMDMRNALTIEVADKHDIILNLRRDVQQLEEQCRQSNKQTQFKDDITKELRKEIKQLKSQEYEEKLLSFARKNLLRQENIEQLKSIDAEGDVSALKERLKQAEAEIKALKDAIAGANKELEKLYEQANEYLAERDDYKRKHNECASKLAEAKSKLDAEGTKFAKTSKENLETISALKKSNAANKAELEKTRRHSEAVSQAQNETIEALQEALKERDQGIRQVDESVSGASWATTGTDGKSSKSLQGRDGESGGYAQQQGMGVYPGGPGAQGYTGGPGVVGYPGGPGTDAYPGGPGAQGYLGGPGAVGYPGGPGTDAYPGGPGTQEYTGGPGSVGYPGRPGSVGYPGGPGSVGYPGGPGTDAYPGGPGTQGYPGGPGTDAYPGGPGGQGYPGGPGTDAYPGGPGGQGYPGGPGTDAYPGGPGGQEYPGGPGTDAYPGGPGGQGYPGGPGGQGYPGGPGTDAYPGGPGTNAYPGGPGGQGYPGGPGAQEYPGGPGAEGYPGGPGAGAYPGGPGAGAYPGGPGADAYPGGPGAKSYPGGPGAEAYSGEPGAGGYPGKLDKRASVSFAEGSEKQEALEICECAIDEGAIKSGLVERETRLCECNLSPDTQCTAAVENRNLDQDIVSESVSDGVGVGGGSRIGEGGGSGIGAGGGSGIAAGGGSGIGAGRGVEGSARVDVEVGARVGTGGVAAGGVAAGGVDAGGVAAGGGAEVDTDVERALRHGSIGELQRTLERLMKEREAERAKHTQQLANLKETILELEKGTGSLRANMQGDMDSYQNSLNVLQASEERARIEISQLRLTIANLQEALVASKQQLEQLQQKASSEVHRYIQHMNDLKNVVSTVSRQCLQYYMEVKSLHALIEHLRDTNLDLEVENFGYIQDVAMLETRLLKYQSTFNNNEECICALENELVEQQAQNTHLKQHLCALTCELTAMQRVINEAKQLHQRFLELQEAHEDQLQQTDTIRQELIREAKLSEIDSARIDELQQMLCEKSCELNHCEQQYYNTQRKLDTTLDHNNELKDEIAQLIKHIKKYEQSCIMNEERTDTCEQEIEECRINLNDMKEKLMAISELLHQKIDQYNQLETNYYVQGNALACLKQQLAGKTDYEDGVNDLKRTNEKLKCQVCSLQTTMASSNQNCQATCGKLSKCLEELKALRAQRLCLEARNEQYRTELQDLQTAYDELSQSYNQLLKSVITLETELVDSKTDRDKICVESQTVISNVRAWLQDQAFINKHLTRKLSDDAVVISRLKRKIEMMEAWKCKCSGNPSANQQQPISCYNPPESFRSHTNTTSSGAEEMYMYEETEEDYVDEDCSPCPFIKRVENINQQLQKSNKYWQSQMTDHDYMVTRDQ